MSASVRGVAPKLMIEMDLVTLPPVVSVQNRHPGTSEPFSNTSGEKNALLAVETILRLYGVVPSDAPPLRTMVVSSVIVPWYVCRKYRVLVAPDP